MKHVFLLIIYIVYKIKKDTYDLYVSIQSMMSPIVDTHTGFQVQLSIHIRIKIKKEDTRHLAFNFKRKKATARKELLHLVFQLTSYKIVLTK